MCSFICLHVEWADAYPTKSTTVGLFYTQKECLFITSLFICVCPFTHLDTWKYMWKETYKRDLIWVLILMRSASIHCVSFHMHLPIHKFRHIKIHMKRDLQKRPNMSPYTHEEYVDYSLRVCTNASTDMRVNVDVRAFVCESMRACVYVCMHVWMCVTSISTHTKAQRICSTRTTHSRRHTPFLIELTSEPSILNSKSINPNPQTPTSARVSTRHTLSTLPFTFLTCTKSFTLGPQPFTRSDISKYIWKETYKRDLIWVLILMRSTSIIVFAYAPMPQHP